MNRREFIKTSAAIAAGVIGQTQAQNRFQSEEQLIEKDLADLTQYDFILPRIKFADQGRVEDYWLAKPGGDANLLRELSRVIRCKTKPILNTNDIAPLRAHEGQLNAVVTLDEPKRLKNFPFLFMTGESHYTLSNSEKTNLKNYLEQGGFIFMDDCMANNGSDFFFQSSCEQLGQIFGQGAIRKIPISHELFHNIFDLSDISLPRCFGKWHGPHGVFIEDRLAVMLSSHDIHCGWADSRNRYMRYVAGAHTHADAIHFGINLVMYAMAH